MASALANINAMAYRVSERAGWDGYANTAEATLPGRFECVTSRASATSRRRSVRPSRHPAARTAQTSDSNDGDRQEEEQADQRRQP